MALLATACGTARTTHVTRPGGSAGPSRAGPAVSASARIVYSVRDNTQDPPSALTGGDGDSVWSWDVGTSSALDYVSALTRRERVYRLVASCCGGGVRGYTGLTVGPNGLVWAVLNHTLLRLDSGSGRISVTTLPAPARTDGAPSMGRQTEQSFADLVSVSPDDRELVVGFDDAAALARYSLTNGTPGARPSMIALPKGYFALDVAILSDDTIGVGMERFGSDPEPALLLVHPGRGAMQVRVADAWGVVADGRSFLVGDYRPELVTEAGRVRAVPADFKLPSGDRWVENGAAGGPNRLIVLPGGLIARTIDNGLVEVASRTRSRLFAMPLQRYRNLPDSCLGCFPPGRSTTTTTTLVPPPKWIWKRDVDQQLVSDHEGDLWILTQTPATSIAFAEITAAQLRVAFG